jgi:dihydroorotate dehydrogenase (fumarate)
VPDLTCTYLGLKLAHPIIASASPLTSTVDGIRAMEDAGAAAVVMASLFEEQIRAEDTAYAVYTDYGSYSQPEAGNYFPEIIDYDEGVAGHLDTVSRAAEAVDIPVIASLNALTLEGWTDYAARLEQAGAAALELNIHYIPTDFALAGSEVEAHYVDVVRAVKSTVGIPVALKLSPYFSALGNLAQRLAGAGADGLVLFNRFYQPDFELEALEVDARLELSSRREIGLPLLWIALLSGRVNASLAATTGVETADEVLKYLLAGADAVMSTSALLRHGPAHLRTLVAGVSAWLERHGHASVRAIRGLKSAKQLDDARVLLRSQYMNLLTEYVPDRLAV